MVKDGKIVGLKESSNGRSYVSHDCCGEVAMINELVWFKLTVVDIDGKNEEAIQAVHIWDGTALCIIGFLPRNIVQSGKDKYVGKFAQIIELYDQLECEVKRRKSYQNRGVASFQLLDNISDKE
jgi:primosomal replication protein N